MGEASWSSRQVTAARGWKNDVPSPLTANFTTGSSMTPFQSRRYPLKSRGKRLMRTEFPAVPGIKRQMEMWLLSWVINKTTIGIRKRVFWIRPRPLNRRLMSAKTR